MQQSPTISIEQDLSSVRTSLYSNETILNRNNILEKWRRLGKRIILFFRLIKVSILRIRFIDMLVHMNIDEEKIEELKNYETKKVQEDLLFLDDIKRYHEVFNTFISFGFVWQDKEFRLAKLKANYIFDRYMSTSDAIAKTNIPSNAISSINNRLNSPRVFSSSTYFNLFNDAEKFILEKLLLIYLRKGWKCFSTISDKQYLSRSKGNRTQYGSFLSSETIKEKSRISISPNIKLKNEPQYEEIIIPNWTYSTGQGVVYNPIIEKSVKILKRNTEKKPKEIASAVKLNLDPPEIKQVISSRLKRKFPLPKQYTQNCAPLPSSHDSRCDTIFHKTIFNKNQTLKPIFICKRHSLSSPQFNQSPYRMTTLHQISCHQHSK